VRLSALVTRIAATSQGVLHPATVVWVQATRPLACCVRRQVTPHSIVATQLGIRPCDVGRRRHRDSLVMAEERLLFCFFCAMVYVAAQVRKVLYGSIQEASYMSDENRLNYEAPRAMRIGSLAQGKGDCNPTGSSDVAFCEAPGSSALGSGCMHPGSAAGGTECTEPGNAAVADCFNPGNTHAD